ncbi:MAG: 1-phosphofructokinase [Eubacteriales bacterium]|nr:1-phosphofructokinase [Eubacteriales bacterium]
MIYTVTFNPSLDYIVSVDNFRLGMTNRTSDELMLPGGKGINVSIVLNNLGLESTALGYVAGFTGEQISNMVKSYGVRTDFITIDEGFSRINLKLKNIDGTEINGKGPEIKKEKVDELLVKLDKLDSGDVLVLAGSIPSSISDDIYQVIMRRLECKGVTIVVDATSKLLMNVLEYHPFLIKPNQHELGEIFNVKIESEKKEEIVKYARKLQDKGAVNVLVSMGSKGALLLAEDGGIYEADAPKGILKNSVGAGDSMVAGFMTGYLTTHSYEEAFRMGVSTGSASAFSENLAVKSEVEALKSGVEIRKLNMLRV